MFKFPIICLYILIIVSKLALAEKDKAAIININIPICASSEIKKDFVFSIKSLDTHSSNLASLQNPKNLKIGLIVEKLKAFARSELVFEISPSYSKRIFENTKNRVVIDIEDIELSTVRLHVLPTKQVYWEVVFEVWGGFGDRHVFNTIIFLDGYIPPRVKSKDKKN